MGKEHRPGHGPGHRYTVAQAAQVLGLTVEAVRSRLKRGKIDHVREGGRVYVLLDAAQVEGQATGQRVDHTEQLISTLQQQLEAERQAHAEARRLLAAALERIPPQLEAPTAPSEPRESPETPAEGRPSTTGPPPAETPAESRPWWRRVFGG